ncbi:hypothetical protein Taro_018831 [Colocasia esculenta]|uniref:NAC domain-containing protein n=1 Tax=Colocasia esculenta TaxID=4460 RepID=A0A843USE1_COLES|nr:hypothetical protein [Colocasia esculenta]
MREKGKAKVAAEEQSFFLDDDDYFDDTYDENSNVLVGSRFQPTDQELLGFFLRRKTTKNLPSSHDFIPILELYVSGAEPWFVHSASGMAVSSSSSSSVSAQNRFFLPRSTTDWFFCFSYITPRGPGSSRTAGSGSWVSNGREERGSNCQVMGYKGTFSFKVPDGGKRGPSTNWVMHEYRLPNDKHSKKRGSKSSGGPDSSAQKELVLCRIRRTKASTREEEQMEKDGSFATGQKRRRKMIPDGLEDVELGAPTVPLPPSAGPSTASSDSLQVLFDWEGFERFVTAGDGGVPVEVGCQDEPKRDKAMPLVCDSLPLLQHCDPSSATNIPPPQCAIDWQATDLDLVVQQDEDGQWLLGLDSTEDHVDCHQKNRRDRAFCLQDMNFSSGSSLDTQMVPPQCNDLAGFWGETAEESVN